MSDDNISKLTLVITILGGLVILIAANVSLAMLCVFTLLVGVGGLALIATKAGIE